MPRNAIEKMLDKRERELLAEKERLQRFLRIARELDRQRREGTAQTP